MNKEIQKIKIEKTIFYTNSSKPFTWKDIKHIQFEDDDILHIAYDEGYYSENNSWDPHYFVEITRMVEETDEQFNNRLEKLEDNEKWAKKKRYESYLRLKKEFENE